MKMKTKYIHMAFMAILCSGSFVACSDGDKYFKDERYKKMIYAISDNQKIFHAEFDLNDNEEVIGVQPFAVSGTNPIDQDVTLTVEKDPDLLMEYNYNTFMDESDKYAHELKDKDYSLLNPTVEIKVGENPGYEVGKLQVKIKTSVVEKLSVDSAYFLSFRIKEGKPYEINESKRSVLFRIYKKNQFASQKTATYYASSGFMDDVVLPFDSKIVMPLTFNQVRVYVAGKIYDANDTKETISKNSMVITIGKDNKVIISAYDPDGKLKLEMLSPSSDPNDGSYGYRNYYNPEEEQFYLYYRFDNGEGWKVVRETLKAESMLK